MTTISSLLELRRGDDRPGLVEESRGLAWDEVVAESDRRAGWLLGRSNDRPPHLGVLLPNGIEYLLWIFAAARARWVIVGINPTRRGEALARDIRATDCQMIITDAEGQASLGSLDLGDCTLIDSATAARVSSSADHPSLPESREEDLLLLLFTSGTTGTPKAVRCTTGRLAGIGETAGQAYGYHADDVCYCPMPLFHGNALMALVAPALWSGATIALRPRFSASSFLDDVRTFGATTFTYVGKAIAYVLATAEGLADSDNSLTRAFGTEASSVDRARFEERFGCRLVEGYGSSEGGVNIVATPDTPAGALGPAPQSVDLAVVDPESGVEMAEALFDEHHRLLNGSEAIGEIVNRSGGGKFEGYYGDEVSAHGRLRDGWYWTGDLAYRDAGGFFWFAGRSGDWLRVDSENLAATPIETVLARFGGFAGVAIYAVPDVETAGGDAVMLCAELAQGQEFEPGQFAAWLNQQDDLGTKWAPTFIRITDRLDETATGKITKVRYRAEGWHTHDPLFVRWSRSETYVPVTADDVAGLDQRLDARG
jgi:fatty-acyl-CoA synthase